MKRRILPDEAELCLFMSVGHIDPFSSPVGESIGNAVSETDWLFSIVLGECVSHTWDEIESRV